MTDEKELNEYTINIHDPDTLEMVYTVDRPYKSTSEESALSLFISVYDWRSNWKLSAERRQNEYNR